MICSKAFCLVWPTLLVIILSCHGAHDKGRRHCTPRPPEAKYSLCFSPRGVGWTCDAAFFAEVLPCGAAEVLGAPLLRTAAKCGYSCCIGGCPIDCHTCNNGYEKHMHFCWDSCECIRPPKDEPEFYNSTEIMEDFTEDTILAASNYTKYPWSLCIRTRDLGKPGKIKPHENLICSTKIMNEVVPEELRKIPGIPNTNHVKEYHRSQYCCAGGNPQSWCGSCIKNTETTNGVFGRCGCI